MKQLRNAIAEAFPGQGGKNRDSIDPIYVEAAGTAYQARIFALNPDLLQDGEPCPPLGNEPEHVEL